MKAEPLQTVAEYFEANPFDSNADPEYAIITGCSRGFICQRASELHGNADAWPGNFVMMSRVTEHSFKMFTEGKLSAQFTESMFVELKKRAAWQAQQKEKSAQADVSRIIKGWEGNN